MPGRRGARHADHGAGRRPVRSTHLWSPPVDLGREHDARARFRIRPGVVVTEQNTKLPADVGQLRRPYSPLGACELDSTEERYPRCTQSVFRATREEDTPIERRVVGGQELRVVDPRA